ncbi:ORF V: Enzymatic polyprotein [Labeo rohita]|uniref:ORF V: Enzymatic polyprotein n=1 Tax=Labeo rohita TaxID=84645 RepID=A0ABQ8KYU0_LABRO|nr:ORF V: Enzymatic polyprotein [Labeo rohita]
MTAGSDGSCVQCHTFCPAVHESPTVVAQDQGPGVGSSLSSRNSSDSHPTRGLWCGRHLTWHINCLEMLAVFWALKHFLPDLIGHHVLVRTDNTAVVYYINHQGGLCSRPLYKLAHQILVWPQDKLLSLRAVHVPGHLNMGADILSRQGQRPGEWLLHPKVDRFSAGLAHSTLRVYVAAISAYHAPLGGMSLGKDPLVVCFLCRALRLRPPVRPRVPSWDLAVVLEALYFSPGMAKAFLYPRSGYVPKVPSVAPLPVVLQAFCPPPFRELDQQKLNCMCPVQALDTYVRRAAVWRKTDQLFICYGPPKRGLPASKQTLSRWIVDAITQAYDSSGLPSPLGVKAHST